MLRDEKGYTLIELIAVMVIISVLAIVALNNYRFSHKLAEQAAANHTAADLNSRETGEWAMQLLDGNYQNDYDVWAERSNYLAMGRGQHWVVLNQEGGKLAIGGNVVEFTRRKSDVNRPGYWQAVFD